MTPKIREKTSSEKFDLEDRFRRPNIQMIEVLGAVEDNQ